MLEVTNQCMARVHVKNGAKNFAPLLYSTIKCLHSIINNIYFGNIF